MKVDLDVNKERVLAVDVPQGDTEGRAYEVSVALVHEDVLFSASDCWKKRVSLFEPR